MNGKAIVEVTVPVKIVKSRSFFRRAVIVVEMPNGTTAKLREGDTLNVHATLNLKADLT
jgi:hypothetical protein